MMPLMDFYKYCVDTIQPWYDNHTDYGSWIEWSEQWYLTNELEEDEEIMAVLGWTPEEVQNDLGEYCQAYLENCIDNTTTPQGIPARDVIGQIRAVLDGLYSENVWECLASIVQAANLAHVNGFILIDYFVGPLNMIGYIVCSISQRGLEATFPDLPEFIEHYEPYEPDWW